MLLTLLAAAAAVDSVSRLNEFLHAGTSTWCRKPCMPLAQSEGSPRQRPPNMPPNCYCDNGCRYCNQPLTDERVDELFELLSDQPHLIDGVPQHAMTRLAERLGLPTPPPAPEQDGCST